LSGNRGLEMLGGEITRQLDVKARSLFFYVHQIRCVRAYGPFGVINVE